MIIYYNMHATSVIDGNKSLRTDLVCYFIRTYTIIVCKNYVLCTNSFVTTSVTNAIDI